MKPQTGADMMLCWGHGSIGTPGAMATRHGFLKHRAAHSISAFMPLDSGACEDQTKTTRSHDFMPFQSFFWNCSIVLRPCS